jgi:hypothetical protein
MIYLHSFAKERDLLSVTARLGLLAALLAGLALGLVPPQTAQAQGVVRVTTTGATSGTCGDTWANGCDLQYALTTVAASGDEIWVAQGTYRPTSGTDRAATFQLKNGVALYGGFAGTETSRDQRDWENRITTLSGDLNGDDDGFANNGENSYHVVTGGGTGASAILDGFTVTGGNADGPKTDYQGGGMYNDHSSPTLTNVTFSGNTAFDWNDGDEGGGMYNDHSSPTLTNVTFSGNTASGGGGMSNYSSSPTLTDVTFSGNTADYGGGMSNWQSSSPTLTNVTFSGNTAVYYGGGGMSNSRSSPTLTDVTFSGNTADDYGGGMSNWQSSPTLTNLTFSGNTASRGGGMYNNDSSPTLSNLTFSGNEASFYGGGMYNDHSSPTLTNCILWGNTASSGPQVFDEESSSPSVTYSLVQGGYAAGTDIIDADPLFVRDPDPGDGHWGTRGDNNYGNLRLRAGSPAIDAGNNTAVPAGVSVDLAGNPRFIDYPQPDFASGTTPIGTPPIVDLGAYEAACVNLLPIVLKSSVP